MQRWSEPRFTHDADLTLLTGFGAEESFVDKLLGHNSRRAPPKNVNLRSEPEF